MESSDNLELMRIKKEKEGISSHEGEKKPPAKVIEPEIVKTMVPVKVELKEEEKDRPMKVFKIFPNFFIFFTRSIDYELFI